ncbi:MAG: hypothetical protein H0T13_07755, partial [Actinobacteria bacterium]|nr:hypothetical protein [Actinomycetota bacterium]
PLFFVGFGLVAGFIPPPSPGESATQVAQRYAEDRDRIRTGLFITAFASTLLVPAFAVFTIQMRRIEGRVSPLAWVQMGMGSLLVLVFILPLMTFEVAAFRADRSPEILQALNDLAWIPFVAVVWTVWMQTITIAIAILRDRREVPVYPRWLGYLNLWAAAGVTPGAFIVFFKDGPLAWNGILGWWCIVIVFFIWLVAMTWASFRAIDAQVAEEREHPDPGDLADRVTWLMHEVSTLKADLARMAAR